MYEAQILLLSRSERCLEYHTQLPSVLKELPLPQMRWWGADGPVKTPMFEKKMRAGPNFVSPRPSSGPCLIEPLAKTLSLHQVTCRYGLRVSKDIH